MMVEKILSGEYLESLKKAGSDLYMKAIGLCKISNEEEYEEVEKSKMPLEISGHKKQE